MKEDPLFSAMEKYLPQYLNVFFFFSFLFPSFLFFVSLPSDSPSIFFFFFFRMEGFYC